MKNISKKRAKENPIYLKLRRKFLLDHPVCQARLPGCMIRASEVHHKYAGSDRAAHYLDESTWMAVCPICHRQIHDTTIGKELGFLIKEHGKTNN